MARPKQIKLTTVKMHLYYNYYYYHQTQKTLLTPCLGNIGCSE